MSQASTNEPEEVEFEILRPGESGGTDGATPPDSILARLIALVMDNLFRVPGTNFRFGLDPVIGLVPGVGDASGAAVSIAVLVQGAMRGIPKIVLAHMAANIGINTLIGAIPVIGDIFSAFFKSNARNYALLLKHTAPGRVSTRSTWVFLGVLIAMLTALVVVVISTVWLVIFMVIAYVQGG